MEEREKEVRRKLKDDFFHYAEKCLRIRTKSGYIQKFQLNEAQRHIHKLVTQQKLSTGKVRAIILKGRQQGCCFSPDMRVLTADYKWKTLDELCVGEKLVACDEESPGLTSSGRKQSRKFRTAIVEVKREFYKKTYELLFDNGARLNVTPDHRLLSKKRGGDDQVWRYVANLKIGDEIRVATRPPNYICETYEDGWMAGMIDGEGSARLSGAKRISVNQCDGFILNRMKAYFNNIDIPYKEVIDSRKAGEGSKLGNKPVHRLDIHRLPYIMELFSRCRPTRFTNDEWHLGHELPGKAAQNGIKPWAKVIAMKPLETQRVIDVQTSTKTYICEGLVSHNSTYIEGRFYWLTSHRFGVRAFILTHDAEATNNLFEMSQRFHQYCPSVVKPRTDASNAKELIFGQLDSGYKIGTAGNKAVGRSSTIQFLHGSEAAYWPNAAEHAKGIMQAVPSEPGTEVFLESTANGIGNYFHEQWQMAESGQSDFIPIFLPWFWQHEYKKAVDAGFTLTDEEDLLANAYNLNNEQLSWRRNKIMELSTLGFDGTKAFMQEYPNSATEAFITSGEDSFIQPSIVVGARENNLEAIGKLIVGVDPARFGDDRTAIIRRKGRVAYNLQTYTKKDTMEIVGLVHKIIQNEHPYKVCIDIGGLGAGVYDRLKELGHIEVIEPVNGGSSPLDAEKYYNKRAEMWAELKQWLMDGPVQIPNSDELHADLCGIRYSIDSKSRLLMEKKEAMKKRGIRSCDTADALAYTFYYQETQLIDNTKEKSDKIIADMMSNFMRIDRIRQNRG